MESSVHPSVDFFLGATTPAGFKGYFAPLRREPGMQLVLLKSGPGCGKSTLMKRLARAAQDKGEPIQRIHCASDPDSLDGVVFLRQKRAIIDATAPHVVEPEAPGADERVLSLYHTIDADALHPHKDEVTALFARNQLLRSRAARYVASAGSLLLALDIQEAALQASRARLEQAGMAVRCCASAAAACALPPLPSHTTDIRLVLHSHAALPELLDALPEEDRQRPLLAGIFNFGYLPGTDKRCTTTAAGSLAAVDALLERLAPQGCLSLHCYTGHEGGAAEEAALAQRLARLEPRRWRVLHCRDANRETHGESILLAERLPVRQR